jgi:hypothetical protein
MTYWREFDFELVLRALREVVVGDCGDKWQLVDDFCG